MTPDGTLQSAIADAVSAFDEGNHAWGRFYLYTLRPYHGPDAAPDATPVRAALQEAALSVPAAPVVAEVRAFAVAIALAGQALEDFIDLLPPALRLPDVLDAPQAFAEAIAALQPWLDLS